MTPTIYDPTTREPLNPHTLTNGQAILIDFLNPDDTLTQVEATVRRVTATDTETRLLILLTARNAMVTTGYTRIEP